MNYNLYIRVALWSALSANTLSSLLCSDINVFWMGARFIAVLFLVIASFCAVQVRMKNVTATVLLAFACVILWTQYRIPVWLLVVPAIIDYRRTISTFFFSVRGITLRDIGYSLGISIAILSVRQFTTPRVGLLRYTLNQHTDTVHHAAFSEMIGNFGVVSTGMNGLVETPYHVLSHRLVYILSRLALTDSFTAYPYVLILIYLPLLAVLSSRLVDNTSIAKSSFLVLGLILVAVKLLRGVFISDVFLSSETQVLSMIILVVYLSQRESNLSKQIPSGLAAMSLCLLATLSKGPIGVILWCTEVVRSFVTIRKITVAQLFVCVVGGLFLGVAILYAATGNSGAVDIGFVPFVNRISMDTSWMKLTTKLVGDLSARRIYTIEYFLGHYSLSVGLIAYGLFKRHDMRSRLWVSLIISTIIGIIVDLFLDLGGPNNYWITCIQFFIATILLSSLVVSHRWSNRYAMVGIALTVGLLGIPNFRLKVQEGNLRPDARIKSILTSVDNMRKLEPTILRDDIGLSSSLSTVVPDWKSRALYFPAFSGRPWANVIQNKQDSQFIGWTYDFYEFQTTEGQDNQLQRSTHGLSITDISKL